IPPTPQEQQKQTELSNLQSEYNTLHQQIKNAQQDLERQKEERRRAAAEWKHQQMIERNLIKDSPKESKSSLKNIVSPSKKKSKLVAKEKRCDIEEERMSSRNLAPSLSSLSSAPTLSRLSSAAPAPRMRMA